MEWRGSLYIFVKRHVIARCFANAIEQHINPVVEQAAIPRQHIPTISRNRIAI
jgi:hypothetical protein